MKALAVLVPILLLGISAILFLGPFSAFSCKIIDSMSLYNIMLTDLSSFSVFEIPSTFNHGSIATLHTNDTGLVLLELGYKG
jgi:hypothetical protein